MYIRTIRRLNHVGQESKQEAKTLRRFIIKCKIERKKNQWWLLGCVYTFRPINEAATCLPLSRCKLPAVRPVALYAHIVLKSIRQSHRPPCWIEKVDQILIILVRLNADILFFDFWIEHYAKYDSMISDTKCVWLNERLNSTQSVVSAYYRGKSVDFWKCWFLLVKGRLYADCTTKKKRHPNPRKLPYGANCLRAQRPDGCIRWQPGVVRGRRLVDIMRI